MRSELLVLKKLQQYILCFLLASPLFTLSQVDQNSYHNTKIDTLIQLYVVSKNNNKIKIYSIQINSSESLEQVELIQKKYTSIFPKIVSEIIFEAPEYKLMTGFFIDKKDAEKELKKIKKKFKNSFIFQQEILMSKFKESKKFTY